VHSPVARVCSIAFGESSKASISTAPSSQSLGDVGNQDPAALKRKYPISLRPWQGASGGAGGAENDASKAWQWSSGCDPPHPHDGSTSGGLQLLQTVQRLRPAATASWAHSGHCRFVHGYSRSFHLWFRAQPTRCQRLRVISSGCRPSKPSLPQQFDHTFLVNADDPFAGSSGAKAEAQVRAGLDLRVWPTWAWRPSAELVLGLGPMPLLQNQESAGPAAG